MEFVVDAADVIAHGVDADLELAGSALITVALREQPQQAQFLRRELIIELFRRAGLLKQRDDVARRPRAPR